MSAGVVAMTGEFSYEWLGGDRHRHGGVEHAHPRSGAHDHPPDRRRAHTHGRDPHGHGHGPLDRRRAHAHNRHAHEHGHGPLDPSITRSRAGLPAVLLSLAVVGATALAQALVFVLSGSVALLADLIHNAGDALTAVPVGVAFLLRSERPERLAGVAVVAAILISACVAGVEAVTRLLHPSRPEDLAVVAAAGGVGFLGNWVAARIRTRAGRRLDSPALVADGAHARADGYVSLAVVASAAVVALGLTVGDPLIGLAITLVILRITWQSWRTVHAGR